METVTIAKAEYDSLKTAEANCSVLEQHVKILLEQIRLSRHKRFGVSSEKSAYEQPSLFNEADALADAGAPEPELIEVEKHYRKARRALGDRLSENLPVETIDYELPENERDCPECGGPMHVMGHDSRRELVIVPAQVKIVEHRRTAYSCRHCEKHNDHTPMAKALLPEPVIKGGFASPEAVAHIMAQKFVMGVPLYRQEQELLRSGIALSRQTMSNWLIRCAEDWLGPIYRRLKTHLLEQEILHADETTLQVLHEPGKTAQSKSYMWLYRSGREMPHPIVLYEYQPSRKASHPEEFLRNFKGYLHTDGYSAYHGLPDDIVVVGCWAHLRRKFDEALKALPNKDRVGSSAMRGKRYCDRLFEIERGLDGRSPEELGHERQAVSRPLVEDFFSWVNSLNALPKTGLGQALHYARSQQKYLERYLLDGRLEISNNRAERSIKPFVIGRKNWLFANTPKGATASAVIYSIMETAKENGLNPSAYLTYIFKKAPNLQSGDSPDALEKMMPWMAPDYCKGF